MKMVSVISKSIEPYCMCALSNTLIQVSYRRNGHNETDNPMFTQPLMYQVIAKQPNVLKLYSESLIKAGVIPAEEVAVSTLSMVVQNKCRSVWDYVLLNPCM